MEDSIKVLVVDDSALMRKLISQMVEEHPSIKVVGTAINGRFALEKIPKLKPDVILLDLEMPEMNGIEFLKELRKTDWSKFVSVVIVSSLARKGSEITMEALSLGADDFVSKPSGNISLDINLVRDELIEKVIVYGTKVKRRKASMGVEEPKGQIPIPDKIDTEIKPAKKFVFSHHEESVEIPDYIEAEHLAKKKHINPYAVLIGISTGGPNALREILPVFPQDFPLPILVVQHMPPGFTREFAKSLNSVCYLEVKEAEDEDLIKRGRILVAPGGKQMKIRKIQTINIVNITNDPPMNGHKPSVDYMYFSAAEAWGRNVIAVIMTGMGKDGAKGMKKLHDLGAITVAQDRETSVVWGMPKSAVKLKGVDVVLPLNAIPQYVIELTKHLT